MELGLHRDLKGWYIGVIFPCPANTSNPSFNTAPFSECVIYTRALLNPLSPCPSPNSQAPSTQLPPNEPPSANPDPKTPTLATQTCLDLKTRWNNGSKHYPKGPCTQSLGTYRALVIVTIVQVLGKYVTIRYLDPWDYAIAKQAAVLYTYGYKSEAQSPDLLPTQSP